MDECLDDSETRVGERDTLDRNVSGIMSSGYSGLDRAGGCL